MKILIFLIFFLQDYSIAQNSDYYKMLDKLLKSLQVPTYKIKDKLPPNTVIIDARSQKEFNVSHIKNAQIWSEAFLQNKRLKTQLVNKYVLVYCTVGYRSAKLVERLRKTGIKAYNLYGGIFEWKNKNLKLYDSNGETQKVHTFNSQWSKWLNNGVKVVN